MSIVEEESSYLLFLLLLPLILSFKPKLSYLVQALVNLSFLILSFFLINQNFYGIFEFKTGIDLLTLSFKIDTLSLFFIGLIFLLSTATSIYSTTYIDEFKNKKILTAIYNGFIISMVFVVLSNNVLTFLTFWELMSVLSFFLVIFDYKKEENLKAGVIYIFMTHLGTGFILLSFILLYLHTGSLNFNDFHKVLLPENIKFLIFIFSLIGFGAKAGLFPLHFWLPKAHPVAPSNVSALMSGVMIKTAVYMLIRFYFDFLDSFSVNYGYIVLFIGSLTAIYGILYAYVQTDIKKLLAYSSMENIGIIFIAMGLSLIFKSNNISLLLGISFIAMLFHTLNHTVFKGLLFLGAGSILYKTHTKNMEELGGLIKVMPKTGWLFLIGILGITALPPFNGFVSEWLIYQSLLFGSKLNYEFISFTIPIFASILALTGAFALGAFTKLFGISFLGIKRTDKVSYASEVDKFMLFGKSILAVLVVVLGLFPFIPIYYLDYVLQNICGISIYNNIFYSNGLLLVAGDYDFGRIAPFGLAIAGIMVFLLIYFFTRVYNAKIREYETWACGLDNTNLTNKAQYSATGFSQPIRRIFGFLYKTKEELNFNGKKYFLPKKAYKIYIEDRVEYFLYKLTSMVIEIFLKLRYYIQPGIIHVYIAYIIITLIAFIIFSVGK